MNGYPHCPRSFKPFEPDPSFQLPSSTLTYFMALEEQVTSKQKICSPTTRNKVCTVKP